MTAQPFSPGLDGVIATDSSVSYLDEENEQIVVRGYDLIELARNLNYTDVAYLVMYGELPDRDSADSFCRSLAGSSDLPGDVYRLLDLMPKGTSVMDALRTGISYLAGHVDPGVLSDTSREANLAKGESLLAQAPVISANAYRALNGLPFVKPDPELGYSENFLYMLSGERPDAEALDVFDRILICYIEHEMPNSTFVARVIASTLSDVYGAVAGGVASLKGPLHGGANEAAIAMMLEIQEQGGPSRAEPYVMEKLANRERIMGFGHRVYMRKHDPRALFLSDYIDGLAARVPDGRDLAQIYRTVERVMEREKGLFPNTDYPIALLFYLLGIPVPLYTPVFLCSRMAGLVAHVVEQHEDNKLYRPRLLYEGARGLTPPASPISAG